jgi:hypothetical protein
MRYRIEAKSNDGLAEAPAFEAHTPDVLGILEYVAEELSNDEGQPLPVGTTLTIERIA